MYEYINQINNDEIVVCEYIKLAVKRFEKLKNRDDIYFDEDKVNDVIFFIEKIKHYLGKHKGKNFILMPWQKFIVANLFGLYYKESGKRLTNNVFILMSRKNGKSAFAAALSLYMLIFEGEWSPEIVFAANSREQAKILFDITTQFTKSLDPNGKLVKPYRNEIKFKTNNGKIQIVSADTSKLDGKNLNFYCIDEYHEAKDTKMNSVLQSSQGMRDNPMGVIISTAGFNLQSPCYDLYNLSIEILQGIKTDDSFFCALFVPDEDDDWTDEKNFIKSNPNLNVTVTSDYLNKQIVKAKNNQSEEIDIKTKNLNMWCSSSETWISHEYILKNTQKIYLKDFEGQTCWGGVDLSETSDLASITLLFHDDEKDIYTFYSKCYLPESALHDKQNKELYRKWTHSNELTLTPGNTIDYDYILNDLLKINNLCPISEIYYDNHNATQFVLNCNDNGLNMTAFAQGKGRFNAPTKQLEILIRQGKAVIDDNEITRWCFSNVILKPDHAGNIKPEKPNNRQKIDITVTMIQALACYIECPKYDTNIYIW